MPHVHIVGAGLAGLTSAVALAKRGIAATLYEASGHAGGRCRSFLDATLDRLIDNGNHLLLSGNVAALQYLDDIGAGDRLHGPDRASFPFVDLASGARWSVRPNTGLLPWWIFAPGRRVPDSTALDYIRALRLAFAGADGTVADCLDRERPLYQRFWEPLAVAALNTPLQTAAASLFWRVVQETFAKGEAACRPRIAHAGLSATFVEPGLSFLRNRSVAVDFGHRLRRIDVTDGRATTLDFGTRTVRLNAQDRVLLAVPPDAAAALVPGLTVPVGSHAIVNVHFRLTPALDPAPDPPFLGLIGGVAEWLFVRDDVVSVTVSAADKLAEAPAELIARDTWRDVALALGRQPEPLPPYRVIKERRATFAQTPEAVRRRPKSRTSIANLFLAGDWIDTGLPATIESAVRSGNMAARIIIDDYNHMKKC